MNIISYFFADYYYWRSNLRKFVFLFDLDFGFELINCIFYIWITYLFFSPLYILNSYLYDIFANRKTNHGIGSVLLAATAIFLWPVKDLLAERRSHIAQTALGNFLPRDALLVLSQLLVSY